MVYQNVVIYYVINISAISSISSSDLLDILSHCFKATQGVAMLKAIIVLALCLLVHLHSSNSAPMLDSSILNGEECDDEKTSQSCLCYRNLERALFATERNRVNLKKTFFPPEDNSPEFVQVTYHFKNSSVTSVWFWSAKTSYFLHPFLVFQFMSLFFNKPQPYYTGSLDVTLETECMANLSPDTTNLQLLTQRVSS